MTVTAYVLNVREGCGTDSKILTQIKKAKFMRLWEKRPADGIR